MYARYPDTRKHTEPSASGAQTNAIVGGVVEGNVASRGRSSTLKKSVPTNWTTLLHQSIRLGSNATTRKRPAAPRGARSALKVSRHCSPAAVVKKIEPTKNTAASALAPTSFANPGSGPTMKQVAPIANRTPIHHEARRGAHQVPSSSAGRERRDACLRCARDDHSETAPSASRNVTWVVNGPRDRCPTRVHPDGVSGYTSTRPAAAV